MKFINFCMVFLLFYAGILHADAVPTSKFNLTELLKKPQLTEQDREQLFFQIGDNSKSLLQEAGALWKELSTSSDPLQKARLGWLIGRISVDHNMPNTALNISEILTETLSIVETNHLPLSGNEITLLKMHFEVSKDKIPFPQVMDQLLDLSLKIEDPFTRASALARVAYNFTDRRIRTKEVPGLLNEIRQITDYRTSRISPIIASTLNNVAVTFSMMGQTDEEEFLYGKLGEMCETTKMRTFCIELEYSLGTKLIENGEAEAGARHYVKSLDMAKDLQDETQIAASYYGLAMAAIKAQKYQQSIEHGKIAFQLYEKLGFMDWAASTMNNLSVAYLKDKDLKSALKAAQKALAICPDEFKMDQVAIYNQLAVVYEKMQRFDEAYKYMRLYLKGEKITRTDDMSKNYLQLGLKLEEERSAKLKDHLRSEEEKNTLLHAQNALQARELVLTQRLRIIAIILFILLGISAIAMTLAIRRGRQVMNAKAKIQSIMDNIEEGLLTVDANLRIKGEHSAYAQRLFPQASLAERDVFETILNHADVPAEDVSLWRESLQACLGEDSIAWELNGDHLPKQIIIPLPQKQVLSLHWQPLVIDGTIHSFLLSIRDVSSLKALEAEVIAERLRREGMQKHIMEILSHNFHEAKRLILDLGQALPYMHQQLSETSSRLTLLRQLHTSKGIARSLGLQTLSRTIHDLEDALKDSQSPGKAQTFIDQLKTDQGAYSYVFEEVLTAPQTMDSTQNLFGTVLTLIPDISLRLKNASLTLGGMDVQDNIMNWDEDLLKDVRDILVHSLANAVDHGFILPLSRGATPGNPHITIRADRAPLGIALTIKDNGAGLDWAKLESLAKEKGFTPAPGQSLADVLLLDGVSTAEHVSETSGRGVGLAAVHSICLEHRGHLKIASNPDGSGTLLEMFLAASSG